HRFDFDLRTGRKARDLQRGPGRRRLSDAACVDLVHAREITQIEQKDRRLHDSIEPRACLFENRLQVVEDLLRLLLDRLAADLRMVGLERELAWHEDESVRADR